MAEELEEGTLLNGRYRIVRALGRGGMGTVYLAEHVRLDTTIAVKEVRGQHASEAEYQLALEQCEQEARFLVRLNHPNLPKVMDAFAENDRFYLVMEYIEGVTLEARLKAAGDTPLKTDQVMEWGLQIADVLAYLHSQEPPIIFRDLKPANIMVQPDGHVRLIDFGIARRFNPEANKDTALLGSVGYSPPEQFGRHQTDVRSDIYAFGATLHHLLTGRDPAIHPFKFPLANKINPAVPESLAQLLQKCLAMDIEARPPSIHAVAQELLVIREQLAPEMLAANLAAPAVAGGEGGDASALSANSEPSLASSGARRPKIISSKLAEAEAQRRRTGRHERRTSGTGDERPRVISARTWRTALRIAVGSLAVMAIAAAAVSLRSHVSSVPKTAPTVKQAEPTVPPVQPAPSFPAVSPDPPLPPSQDRSAQIGVDVPGILRDPQGGLLRLHANGHVAGRASSSGAVAAFFYDGEDRPLAAVDPHSVYANQQGQLSVAHSLQITSDNEGLDLFLDVPLCQFPPAAFGGPVKVRCVVFLDGDRAAETDLVPLPFALPTPQPSPRPTGPPVHIDSGTPDGSNP